MKNHCPVTNLKSNTEYSCMIVNFSIYFSTLLNILLKSQDVMDIFSVSEVSNKQLMQYTSKSLTLSDFIKFVDIPSCLIVYNSHYNTGTIQWFHSVKCNNTLTCSA